MLEIMQGGLGDRWIRNEFQSQRVYSFRRRDLFTISRKKSKLWEKSNRGKGVGRDFCMGISYSMSTMKGELNIPRAKCLKSQVVKTIKTRRWAAVPILLISMLSVKYCLSAFCFLSHPTRIFSHWFFSHASNILFSSSFSLTFLKLATNTSKFSV